MQNNDDEKNHGEDGGNARPEPAIGVSIGIGLGMCIGVALGLVIDNLGLGICLGVGLGGPAGVAIGAGLKRTGGQASRQEKPGE